MALRLDGLHRVVATRATFPVGAFRAPGSLRFRWKHAAAKVSTLVPRRTPCPIRAEAPTEAGAAVAGDTIPLLTPYQLGPFPLLNRVVYAPLTRNRANGAIPQPAAATYYSQRAGPGQLIITEATVVSPDGFGYPNCPGIFTEEQVEAWKPIVRAVKEKGGIFLMQLWHCGRCGHPAYMPDGVSPPLAPSPVPISDAYTIYTPSYQPVKPVVPKEMTHDDIKRIVAAFREGARNAIRAGFDGVEIHGANGYLLDEFLKDGCNRRTDEYGGPIENRARFHLEVVDAIAAEIGPDRLGLRLSPYEGYLESSDSDPLGTNMYMVGELNKRGILYLHMVEGRASVTASGEEDPAQSLEPFRKAYKNTFIAAGGYTRDTGNEAIASGQADLVAYGRLFLANPDLPRRFLLNAPLNEYDRNTFYTNDQVKGYTDYPFLEETVSANAA